MRNSKLIVSATFAISAILGIGTASAADLAARPYTKAAPMMVALYDWSGFYIGLNGGGGWSRKCWELQQDRGAVRVGDEGCHNATGGVVGGQVGYRWQSSAWVFGLEAQGDWANLRGVTSPSAFAPFFDTANHSKVDAFGLFTGQVGYSWNNVLLYVKGGAAVTSDKYQGTLIVENQLFDTASETRWGGVVGVGLEIGFAPNWSVAAEYDHMFMGNHNVAFACVGTIGCAAGLNDRLDNISQNVDLVTVRVNYRFGGPVIAKY
jgi:outer membrane immunogenic protein